MINNINIEEIHNTFYNKLIKTLNRHKSTYEWINDIKNNYSFFRIPITDYRIDFKENILKLKPKNKSYNDSCVYYFDIYTIDFYSYQNYNYLLTQNKNYNYIIHILYLDMDIEKINKLKLEIVI